MPEYSITGPDGKTYSIEGPAGATREQIIGKIKERMGQQEPPPAEPATTLGGVARAFGSGIAKGAIAIPGAPGDVQELGRSYNPFDYLAERYREAYPEQAAKNRALAEKTGRVSDIGETRLPTTGEIRGKAEKVTGPLYEPKTTAERYAGSIGEFVPSALAQPGGVLTKAVTTVAGGVGAAGGGDVAEALDLPRPVGEFAGGVFGGAAGGAAAAGRTAARARRLLPTSEQNRQASKDAIHAVERSGTVLDTSAVVDFLQRRPIVLDSGQTAVGFLDAAKKRFFGQPGSPAIDAAKQIEDAGGDLATVMHVHGNLGRFKPIDGSDYAAAMFTREQIRDWVGSNPKMVSGDPQFAANWQMHRDTWRVHSNLEEIEDALNSAEWRRMSTGAGSNLNTIRQNIRQILDNDTRARRYSPEARAMMAEIVEGDLARNTMRRLAKFAPHGPVSAIPTMLAAMTGGADFGAAVAAGGFIAHFFQHRLEQRSLDALLDIIREGSPLTTPHARSMVARAREPITGVSAARGALAAGAGSPLAEQPEPEEAPPHPGL